MKHRKVEVIARAEKSIARQVLLLFALSFAIYCLFVQITKTFLA